MNQNIFEKLMNDLNMKVFQKKLPPMQRYHKLRKWRTSSRIKILCPDSFLYKKVIENKETIFMVYTDVLEGTHPYMAGLSTLQKMQAALGFG